MPNNELKISVIGVSWYHREDFENIKKILVDGENIGKSYDDWLRMAEKEYNHLISNGHLVEKVFISSIYFPEWCKENNLELNSKARIAFANYVVKKKYNEMQEFDSLCPLFLNHKYKNQMEQIGTGVIISISQTYFLLTAAHIIDKTEYGDLFVPCNKILEPVEGLYSCLKIPEDRTRDDDKIDIGYIKLKNQFAERLHKSINPLSSEDIYFIDDATESVIYTFAGYPLSKSKVSQQRAQSKPFYYSGLSVEKGLYLNYGYNPLKNIIVHFRRDMSVTQEGDTTFPPFPRGISGGGIFVWPEDFMGQIIPPNRKLIGIAHTYKDNLLIGTNIREFFKAIIINNPSLNIDFKTEL